ncbi:hypothetical protein RhiJN_13818 [Ceratobasidium sp. AG-Ba]|nr:hypothetical protein RhiJN_13818 [Ceratobasidium sp. AG-Ba]QRW14375.1 hypothetical protein RhiLY_13374 [Ceratobasidium sp. AG-Ba]
MIFSKSVLYLITIATAAAISVSAAPKHKGEKHTVTFVNKCLFGTPKLQRNGRILNEKGKTSYTEDGRLTATAWLEYDKCGENGEKCSLVVIDLENGTQSNNADSSVYIDLSAQYGYSVPVKFQYQGPCNGGNQCLSESCCPDGAACDSNYQSAERQCLGNNANLEITFCP